MVSKAIIEQQRREFGYPVPSVASLSGSLLSLDLSTGLVQQWTLNANCFMAEPVNPPNIGDKVVLIFTQGGLGNFTLTWGVCFRDPPSWSGAAAGTRATAEFIYDGVSYQCVGSSSAFAASGFALVPNTGAVGFTSDAVVPRTNPAPTSAAITLAGVAPSVTKPTVTALAPPVGAITAAGVAPLVSVILTPPTATLTVQGQVPTRNP